MHNGGQHMAAVGGTPDTAARVGAVDEVVDATVRADFVETARGYRRLGRSRPASGRLAPGRGPIGLAPPRASWPRHPAPEHAPAPSAGPTTLEPTCR